MRTSRPANNNLYVDDSNKLSLAESSSEILFTDSSVFGNCLMEVIRNSENAEVKVLVVFQEGISPQEQRSLLNRVGFEYIFYKHYENFPIAQIAVSLKELRISQEKLEQITQIKKLFLDTTLNIPALQNPPHSAMLIDEENWWLQAIGATGLTYNGTGVRIAILDTGIYSNHADFASKTPPTIHTNFASDEGIRNSSDYKDIHGHGTHVAGIAAGTGASSLGKYQGVASGASILNVKVLNDYGGITDSDVIDAVDWIISENKADIISMSFRTNAQDSVYNPVSIALETATRNGIVTVAAAGNDGPQFLTAIHPATANSVISVGAIDRNLNVTSFSSLGPSFMGNTIPDILAPGQDIIAPEAMNSLIGLGERYTNSQISGSQPNSDYIILSGTSMATPMVSGAIALILNAYPDLSPEGVRASLYHGAYLPPQYLGKYAANGIGAGIVNVSASIAWLDSLTDPYSIVQAFPDTLPYEPLDLLSYPGDSQSFNISIFSAKSTPLSISITTSDSPNIVITSNINSTSFSTHSVQYVEFMFKIRENASMGLETGSIFLNDTGTGWILEQIDYTININYPKGRVYFDALHGMNDIYPKWSSGFSQIEIYHAMKTLHMNGYQLVYSMQNWTMDTQSQLISRLLTPDLLSTMDIVILQTPVIGYTNEEMVALKEFIEQGGSLLILGTRYQTMAMNSLNTLLQYLETDILIQYENIFDYRDVGFGYILDKYSISDVDTDSPIFTSGGSFAFWYGATLQTGSNAASIATLQDKTIVASHESGTGGNIVVWSDYHWVRNDIYSSSQTPILLNLFEYLNSQNSQDYSITVNINTTHPTDGDREFFLSILNSHTNEPVTDRIYGVSINASIISPTEIVKPLILNSLGNGVYSNTSFNLNSSDYRPYTIEISISSPSGGITTSYQLYQINGTNQVEIGDPTIFHSKITRSPGSTNDIRYVGNMMGLISELYGSLTSESIYCSYSIRESVIPLIPTGVNYNHTFTLTSNDFGGLFVFFAVAKSPDNYTNFEVTRAVFRIENHLPEIDEKNSYFNDLAFEETRTETSLYILQVNNIGKIKLTVDVEETVVYEDSSSELYMIAHYTAAVSAGSAFDPLYPNTIPTSLLTYNTDQNNFQGEFKIPASLWFSGAKSYVEVPQQSEGEQKIIYFSVLWITVRDTDGGTIDYVILMYVNILFDLSTFLKYLPYLIVILAIIGVAITIAVTIKKRRRKQASSSPYSNITYVNQGNVYCMNCGRQIQSSFNVCPYCGNSQL